MSVGAWLMLAFGCTLLYGGLAVCLFIAAGSKKYESELDDEETPEET